jgi:hypothetical protein
MKKNIVLIVSISIASIHGMETNFWTVTCGNTKINLNKKFILDACAQEGNGIDCAVVGFHEQQELAGCLFQNKTVGECICVDNPLFVPRESGCKCGYTSKAIFFFPYRYSPFFVKVVEPRLGFKFGDDEECGELEKNFTYFFYETTRPDVAGCPINFEYFGDDVMKEASEDLAICYKKVLAYGVNTIGKKEKKCIALPTLGTWSKGLSFAFPRKEATPIAVKSVVEFLKNNPDAYDRVELFVETYLEFILYKLSFIQHCGLLEKICLLYCAHASHYANAYRDPEYPLSLLPRELIHYIANLI